MTQRTRNVRKAWEFSGPEGKSPTIRDIVEEERGGEHGTREGSSSS